MLFISSGIYFFIKVTQGFHFYSFHSLIITTVTFFFLFFEFGKQKCFQLRVKDPSLGKNTVERSDRWTWGVFFYSLAFPMAIVNNFIFFVNYRGDEKTSISEDVKLNIATRNDPVYNLNPDVYSFRQSFMWWVNLIPLICLSIEFCFNQIWFPLHFWMFNFIYSLFYLLWTYFDQIILGRNWYFNNLNWRCV